MKYLKTYESQPFSEIYGIKPGENIIFKDEELKNICVDTNMRCIDLQIFFDLPYGSKNKMIKDYVAKQFKGKIGKFIDYKSENEPIINEFFGRIEFIFNNKKLKLTVPVYMLITDYNYDSIKYNI